MVPTGLALAFDRDPSLLLPTDPQELLRRLTVEETEEHHDRLVADQTAWLQARSGLAPVRFDVISGSIRNSRMPDWLSSDDGTFESQSPAELVLPGTDGVTVPRSLEAHAPLVTHGRGEIPVGGRWIGAEVAIVQRLGSDSLTVLIAPDEAF